ncbi:MAG: cyclase [Parvicella sp.]|jgi:cyclase
MLKTRVIPTLLLEEDSLVKTVKFKKPSYIGDPVNTVRIFNELEVDELCFLDIDASKKGYNPRLDILEEIAQECFMPLSYGGGLNDFKTVQDIFRIGFEKVVINSMTHVNPNFITKVSEYYGSQAVVVSIDVKKSFFGRNSVWSHSGSKDTKKNPVEWAIEAVEKGAGEVLLTSIDKEGTWSGFDTALVKSVSDAISVPVIAHGGAGNLDDIGKVVKDAGASAVALGNMVVYQKKGMGVLVNFPSNDELKRILL